MDNDAILRYAVAKSLSATGEYQGQVYDPKSQFWKIAKSGSLIGKITLADSIVSLCDRLEISLEKILGYLSEEQKNALSVEEILSDFYKDHNFHRNVAVGWVSFYEELEKILGPYSKLKHRINPKVSDYHNTMIDIFRDHITAVEGKYFMSVLPPIPEGIKLKSRLRTGFYFSIGIGIGELSQLFLLRNYQFQLSSFLSGAYIFAGMIVGDILDSAIYSYFRNKNNMRSAKRVDSFLRSNPPPYSQS